MKKQLMKLEQILEIAEKVQDWQFIIQHAIFPYGIWDEDYLIGIGQVNERNYIPGI
jgi:hypothetical protein